MKYIKTFESTQNELEIFFEKFNKCIDDKWCNIDIEKDLNTLKHYKVPEELNDEMAILLYLYKKDNWRTHIETVDNRIKRLVKSHVIKLIQKKLENNWEVYEKLKKMFNDRPGWNKKGTFQNITIAHIKYIFFSLEKAYKTSWVKDMDNYNL